MEYEWRTNGVRTAYERRNFLKVYGNHVVCETSMTCAIDLYADARPERRTLYRLSTAETKALRAEVMGLLDRG